MNLRVPLNAGSFLTSREPVSFTRRTLLHGINMHVSYKSSNPWIATLTPSRKQNIGPRLSCTVPNRGQSVGALEYTPTKPEPGPTPAPDAM